jgi:hypothetical protein
VRREEDAIAERAQRRVLRQRFELEHVERRAAQPAFLDGFRQSGFTDDLAARRVDHDADGFISASSSASIMKRVSAVSVTWNETTSASRRSVR